jgi:hypothetical protein
MKKQVKKKIQLGNFCNKEKFLLFATFVGSKHKSLFVCETRVKNKKGTQNYLIK